MAGEPIWYFAYGSNMQRATFAGRRGIAPVRALAARVRGWRLVLDKQPLIPIGESFANIVPHADAETFGVVYEICEDDLAHVDLTEGVLIDNYRRIEIAVEVLAAGGDDLPERAFTLVSEKHAPDLRPSARYMALLIEGAEEHGLPAEWVAALRAVPTGLETSEGVAARALLDGALARFRR
jgi:hypothetical protein